MTKTNDQPEPNEFREEFSAKIKKVLIELHGFSYSHGPTDDQEVSSKKFIGRKRRIEKLKSVLTDSSKKTGTYLVTGYRGMGKTSFVNKVLSEIQPINYHKAIIKRLLPLFIISFLINILWITYNWKVPFTFFSISLILILYQINSSKLVRPISPIDKSDPKKLNHFIKSYNLIKDYQLEIWQLIKDFFIKISRVSQNQKFIRLNLILFLGSFFTFLTFWINTYGIIYIIISYFFIYCLIFISIHRFIFKKAVQESIKNTFSKLKKDPKGNNRFVLFLKQTFNNKKRIVIRLNLGYSNLKEIDILKLIARNLKTQYCKQKQALTWRITFILFAYILTSAIFQSEPILLMTDHLKENIGFTDFFPSQKRNIRLSKENFLGMINNQLDTIDLFSTEDYILWVDEFDSRIEVEINEAVNNVKNPRNKEKIDSAKLKIYDSVNYSIIKKQQSVIKKHEVSLTGIKSITIYMDYCIYYIYGKLRDLLIIKNPFKKQSYFIINSYHPDYFFIIYFLIIWYFTKSLSLFAGRNSYRSIARQIKELNNIIDARITTEESGELSNIASILKLTKKNNKQYNIADEREIEKQLLEIIESIGLLPIFSKRSDFIIVFDELDKIEPGFDLVEIKNSNAKYPITENAKQRQQAVLALLANLKYFLSTAKAKFIFIAGREIYDVFLADVADRNFHIGSIFNDVFYLSSFFRDAEEIGFGDTTIRTEEFVCQFLFPSDYKADEYNLKTYNNYLKKEFDFLNVDEKDIDKKDNLRTILHTQKREKIVFLLQQFITFLTHVSNGAPGKIATLFEDYVVKMRFHDEITSNSLYIGNNLNSHFLFFDFNDQYKLGVYTYLLTPIELTINKHAKYSDKLLVSSSFLIDHVFKFHRDAFSWRNIESTPELVDINKTPEQRELIDNIMQQLCRTHIFKIINGLQDFRFSNRTAQEINFLSRISEESSAAFNFSLDELQSVKKHYIERIKSLKEFYSYKQGNSSIDNNVNSVESMQVSLADLFYYDGDYSNAITNYCDAMQFMRNEEIKKLSLTQLLLFSRNMLKLGMALEKRKTFDTALLTYGETTHKILEYIKEIPDIKNKENAGTPEVKITKDINPTSNNFLNTTLESIKIFYQPLIAKLYVIEKRSIDGTSMSDIDKTLNEYNEIRKHINKDDKYISNAEFYNKIGDFLYYKNNSDIFNIVTANECSAGIYEKLNECSKCRKKTEIEPNKKAMIPCQACFFYHTSLFNFLNKFLTDDEFLEDDKFKKGYFISILFMAIKEDKIKSDDFIAFSTLGNLLSDLGDIYYSCANKENYINPDFLKVLPILLEDSKRVEKICEYIKPFDSKEKSLGNLESSILYFYLSSYFYKRAGDFKSHALMFTKILYLFKDYSDYLSLKICDEFKNLENLKERKIMFSLIYLAKNSPMFSPTSYNMGQPEINDYYKVYTEKLKNIEQANKYYTKTQRISDLHFVVAFKNLFFFSKKLIHDILEKIAEKSIRSNYSAYDNVHACEIMGLKDTFDEDKDHNITLAKNISLNRISMSPDIEEITILHQSINSNLRKIEIKLFGEKEFDLQNKLHFDYLRLIKNSNYTPFASVSNMYNRIMLLKYRAEYNINLLEFNGINIPDNVSEKERYSKLLNQYFDFLTNEDKKVKGIGKIIDQFEITNSNKIRKDFLEYLLVDTLFCLFEAVKFNNIFERTYGINHNNAATTHYNLWRISEAYEVYCVFPKIIETIRKNECIVNYPFTFTNNKLIFEREEEKLVFDIHEPNIIEEIQQMIETKFYLDKKNKVFSITVAEIYLELDILMIKYNLYLSEKFISSVNFKSINDIQANIDIQQIDELISPFKILNDLNKFVNKLPAPNKNKYYEHKEFHKFLNNVIQHSNLEKLLITDNRKALVKDLIESQNIPFINPIYQCEKSLREFYDVIETHSNGTAYNNLIENMYYLNDDFNDEFFHFKAASERYLINTGVVQKHIDNLTDRIKESSIYNLESYSTIM